MMWMRQALESLAKGEVVEDLESTIEVFDESGVGFYPITRVEVMDISDHFIVRGVDMAADEAEAVVFLGEVFDLIFESAEVIDDGFSFGLDNLGEGEGLFATPCPVAVVNSV